MDLLLFVLSFIVVVFIGTFIHELGHAIGAKMASFQHITITIGTGREIGSFRTFNIEWRFHTLFFLGAYISYETSERYKPLDVAFVAMMGPLCNGITFLLIDIFTNKYLHNGLYLFFLFNAWLVLANVIPLKWNEKQSDGYMILKMIREHMHVQTKQ